jgi:O-antigen ligase
MTRPPESPVESGFGDIMLETGILGLVLWLVMSSAVVLSAWRVARKLKGSPFFPLAFMIALYAFLLLFPMTFAAMQAYQDFILNCYLWLLIGILFRLPTLAVPAQDGATFSTPAGDGVSDLPFGLQRSRGRI